MHGPLVPLLLVLTAVTGMVDAVSYLALNHVFVANMTGNVVFLGFSLAGAADFSLAASLLAVASFLGGSHAGGRLGARYGAHRGWLLVVAVSVNAVLLALSLAAALSAPPVGWEFDCRLVVLLAAAMGIQNAVARRLAVPDLTTSVLTLTLTGLAADAAGAAAAPGVRGRRLGSVCVMLAGAALGAWLTLHAGVAAVLALVLLVQAFVVVVGWRASRRPAAWAQAGS